MKLIDSTNQRANGRMRTLISQTCGGREYNLSERFRIHLIGMYFSVVGREWGSDGKIESDFLHHINVNLSGGRQVIHFGRTYDLAPGEAWYLPANTPVERRCEENCEILFFKFSCECLPGVDPLLDWKKREPKRMCAIDAAEWLAWLDPERPIGVANILGLRARLMWWLAEAIPDLDEAISIHLASHSRFSGVFEYIEEHLGADLRLADLADVYGTLPDAFAAAFTRQTGINPKAYLKRRLNQEAIKWVLNSDMQIKQIADKLRFNDEYYFSRFFQRLNGSPPLRYRNMHQSPR